jgi:hypothetical protein
MIKKISKFNVSLIQNLQNDHYAHYDINGYLRGTKSTMKPSQFMKVKVWSQNKTNNYLNTIVLG